jgi:5'-nucleotidase
MGHAITIHNTLRLQEFNLDENIKEFACSGTPVDCVKLAIGRLLDRKPDICISGINHGSNSSINVIYSGTMSAAVEGCIEGIPSVGFSLCDYALEANFEASKIIAKKIILNLLEKGLPKGVCLNVNIPKLPIDAIQGIKVCRQANAIWEEEFDERKDPYGRNYYWLTGVFKNLDEGDDTDEMALKNGFVSVVPIEIDFTAHHAIEEIKKWQL